MAQKPSQVPVTSATCLPYVDLLFCIPEDFWAFVKLVLFGF